MVGVLNRAAPQSRQTNTTGNVKTPGLVARVGLEKWSVTSPVNSASFSDEHRAQDMTDTLRYCVTSYSTGQTRWRLEQHLGYSGADQLARSTPSHCCATATGFMSDRKGRLLDSQFMSGMVRLTHEPTFQVSLTAFANLRPACPSVFDRVQVLLHRLPKGASRLHKACSPR